MEETQTQKQTIKQPNPYLIPAAIIIGGALIAGAVIFSNWTGGESDTKNIAAPTVSDTTNKVRPVSSSDHIKGNPDAKIKIVTYSDFECPFCQRFHNTMNEMMKKYIENGEVAWVFRQFPLEQLHPVKAMAAAVASECANEQGGNEAFWKFSDRYFELTLTNNRTDIDVVIPQIAKEIGLNTTTFAACRESGKFDERIQADIANAMETGGKGTPWSVLIGLDGKTYPINGALPQTTIEQAIATAKKGK